MFWRKRKDRVNEPAETLFSLARHLGVERRQNARILCPRVHLRFLPDIRHEGASLVLQDLSVGGCCLLDPGEILGPQVGNELDLTLYWTDFECGVRARIVSRVNLFRHLQFLNAADDLIRRVKPAVDFGARAHSMKPAISAASTGPSLDAAELWSSPGGDSIVFRRDVQRLASLNVAERQIDFLEEAWPVDGDGRPLSPEECERAILFLLNIPQPSEALKELRGRVEKLLQGRPR